MLLWIEYYEFSLKYDLDIRYILKWCIFCIKISIIIIPVKKIIKDEELKWKKSENITFVFKLNLKDLCQLIIILKQINHLYILQIEKHIPRWFL